MPIGTVKWYNAEKGFGYITQDDGGPDLFAHHANIAVQGFTPKEYQRVEFQVGQGPKGPQAEHIIPF